MDDEERLAFQELGLSEQQIQQAFGQLDQPEEVDDQQEFVVWRENSPAVDVFLALSSQWERSYTVTGQIIWERLPYEAVLAVLRELIPKRKRRLALFDDLKTMERAALRELNKRES